LSITGHRRPSSIGCPTKVLNDRGQEIGLSDESPEREALACRVIQLFQSGVRASDDLASPLADDRNLAPSRRKPNLNARRQSRSDPRHAFELGQHVRFHPSAMLPLQRDLTYEVKAHLPAVGGALQYRIRSQAETFDRLATEPALMVAEPLRIMS
jgi:hypothetical protein